MSAVLEFKGVSHTFRTKGKDVRALNDVNFALTEGEVFGFVGPNGAGKSTTIKVMLDIINDYQGQVSIYGVDARNASARALLAYVPESPALYEQFTPWKSCAWACPCTVSSVRMPMPGACTGSNVSPST